MARILVTGSTDGVGKNTARALLEEGHDVVAHARNPGRAAALDELLAAGATSVVGDLADHDEVWGLVDQAEKLGPFDAVIHNAGIIDGPALLRVNVLAPYLLTAGMHRPGRIIVVSSGMHRGGRAQLDGIDWEDSNRSYSDSKLYVTTFMSALARLWPDVNTQAVDPGWVPTKMGGSSASDDLALAHVTQAWLATTPETPPSGGYWHHERREETHPAVHDEAFQDALLAALDTATGAALAV